MNCANCLLHNLYHVMLCVSGLRSLTFNPTTMYRSFSIKTIQNVEWFIMFSQFHGEYVDGVLRTMAPLFITAPESLNDKPVSFIQEVELGGNYEDCSFSFRVQELEYFAKVFSLFNPNIDHHEKTSSFPSSDE